MSVYQKESPAHLPGARMAKNKKDGAPPPHSLTSQRLVKSAKRGSWEGHSRIIVGSLPDIKKADMALPVWFAFVFLQGQFLAVSGGYRVLLGLIVAWVKKFHKY